MSSRRPRSKRRHDDHLGPAYLRTERLLLRPWRDEDRAPFAAMNADPVVMKHFPAVLSRAESDAMVDRMSAHFAEHGYGLWALEVRAELVGFTGLSWARFEAPFTPALEIGWRLRRAAWGHGYASEAATAALAYGLEREPSVVSFTAVPNTRSQAVMQRIGMRFEGEFDHPRLEPGHRLRRHVLYRASATAPVPDDRDDNRNSEDSGNSEET